MPTPVETVLAPLGSFENVYKRLFAYASVTLQRRAQHSSELSQMDPADLVNDALLRILSDSNVLNGTPTDIYNQLRRHIDNKAHTIEKSTHKQRFVPLDPGVNEHITSTSEVSLLSTEEREVLAVLSKMTTDPKVHDLCEALLAGIFKPQELCDFLSVSRVQLQQLITKITKESNKL